MLAIVVTSLLACTTKSTSSVSPVCRKFGDTCEFAPGKLGTCIEVPTCDAGATCFACQSQH